MCCFPCFPTFVEVFFLPKQLYTKKSLACICRPTPFLVGARGLCACELRIGHGGECPGYGPPAEAPRGACPRVGSRSRGRKALCFFLSGWEATSLCVFLFGGTRIPFFGCFAESQKDNRSHFGGTSKKVRVVLLDNARTRAPFDSWLAERTSWCGEAKGTQLGTKTMEVNKKLGRVSSIQWLPLSL